MTASSPASGGCGGIGRVGGGGGGGGSGRRGGDGCESGGGSGDSCGSGGGGSDDGGFLTADSLNLSFKLSFSSLARSTAKAKIVNVTSPASLEPDKDLTAAVH